ncbi:MAG: hypothetical protein ACFFD1_16120 [Candidatus Thorarchaeota archaeon]
MTEKELSPDSLEKKTIVTQQLEWLDRSYSGAMQELQTAVIERIFKNPDIPDNNLAMDVVIENARHERKLEREHLEFIKNEERDKIKSEQILGLHIINLSGITDLFNQIKQIYRGGWATVNISEIEFSDEENSVNTMKKHGGAKITLSWNDSDHNEHSFHVTSSEILDIFRFPKDPTDSDRLLALKKLIAERYLAVE